MRLKALLCAATITALLGSPLAVVAAKRAATQGLASEPAAAAAPDRALVIRDTPLRREPFTDAEALSVLPANTAVQPLLRQGAWVQVQAGEMQGWLRLLALRAAAPPAASGASGLQQALNVARTGASGNAVATGVRGLSKEEISSAQPNFEELDKLGRFAADEPLARSFAAGLPLSSAAVPFLEKGDE